MASPRPGRSRTLSRCARFTAVLLGLALAGAASPALATPPDPVATSTTKAHVTTAAASFTIHGRGFGHGWGMSQYGAYGAARQGLTWQQIMAFYYPGTTIGTQSAKATIRVKISADDDGNLKVKAAPGLAVTDTAGTRLTLPTGAHQAYWKVVRSGSSFRLLSRGSGEKYVSYRSPVKLTGSRWTFSSSTKMIKILLPGGSQKQVRGRVAAAAYRSTMRTVNTLPFESYLRSVVPMEMPSSWSPQAVRAQAVAARSYAARTKARAGKGALYDICDTTACQVYQGYARISSAGTRVNEDKAGNAAVEATAHKVLTYGSTIALTQFASSNGGARANGDFPYLKAGADPYDGAVTSQAWSRTITAASLARVYPSAGKIKTVTVTRRDGSGKWGGRVLAMKIVGSKKTITVSGTSFQFTYGLRSNLFTVSGPK